MSARSDALEALAHAMGVGSGDEYDPEYDPDSPLDLHPSHDFRGMRCNRCGALDYWPAAENTCRGRQAKTRGVSLDEMPFLLSMDWANFAAWWRDRGHEELADSFEEWLAQWIEYHRQRRNR